MARVLIYLVLSSFLLSNPAKALSFHLGTGAGLFQANGPEVKSSTAVSGFLFGGISYPLSRSGDLVSELQYSSFNSDAKTNRMGLEAKTIDWSLAYSHQYPFSYQFQPVFSIGVFASHLTLKQRHQVDDAGYLVTQYDDHSAITGGVLLSTQHTFMLDRFDSEWGLGLQVKYAINGVSNIGAFALYRF